MPTTTTPTRALIKEFAAFASTDAALTWLEWDMSPNRSALVVRKKDDFLVDDEYLPVDDIADTQEMFERWAVRLGLEVGVDRRWSKGPNYREFSVPFSMLLEHRGASDEIDMLLSKVDAAMTRWR